MAYAEAYVPVLLNFKDNGIVYSSDDVNALRGRILSPENDVVPCGPEHVFRHRFDPGAVRSRLTGMGLSQKAIDALGEVGVYYYHHRIVLRYSFGEFGADVERDVREAVRRHSAQVLAEHFVARINSASTTHGPLPDETGRVTSYYSYCVMFFPERPGFSTDVENLIGSHTFRIVEVTPGIWRPDRMHIVRISIPSTNIYSAKPPGRFLVVDVLNAIYQHMLYSKKEQDQQQLQQLDSFSTAALRRLNVMQETQLHAFWDHAVDALGGRMVDMQGAGQQANTFRLSIFALVVAIVSVVVTLAIAVL